MRPLEPLHLEGYCYVLLRGNWIHPIAHQRFSLIWYPETSMNLFDQYCYRPYVRSIVTENPWLITLYDRERVLVVYEDGSWRRPDIQTYASDVTYVMTRVLGIPFSVAGHPLCGCRGVKKIIWDYKRRINKANKLYLTKPNSVL